MSKVSKQNWQAEEDAYTMARYEEILSDKKRMNAAIKAAQNKAKDLNDRAAAMNKVAKAKGGNRKK